MSIRNISIKWYLVVFVLFSVWCLHDPAKAAELRLGYGNNHAVWAGDGSWYQEGQPGELTNDGNSFAVQMNDEIFSWLRYTVGYRQSTGMVLTDGEFMSDYCYHNKIFSGGPYSPEHGKPECDVRYGIKKLTTTTTAITAALMPVWKITKDFDISVAYGISRFKHTTSIESGIGHSFPEGTVTKYTGRGVSKYSEISIRYSYFFLTRYEADGETGPEAPATGNIGYLFGVALSF